MTKVANLILYNFYKNMKILPLTFNNIRNNSVYRSKNQNIYNSVNNTVTDSFNLDSHQSLANSSLINFKGSSSKKDAEAKEKDWIFLHNAAVTLRLTDEQKKQMAVLTDNFLKDENINSLYEISGEDYCELQAVYVERIVAAMNLDIVAITELCVEFCEMHYKKDYRPKKNDYIMDNAYVVDICLHNNVSKRDANILFAFMEKLAEEENLPDVFSLVNKEKSKLGARKITEFLTQKCKYSQETACDILISFAQLSKKPFSERTSPDYYDSDSHELFTKLTNQAYAQIIQKELELPQDSLEFLMKTVEKYINPPDKPDNEFIPNTGACAYYIAEKYDLSAEQQIKLKKLLEDAEL